MEKPVAPTPFSFIGVTSADWALVASRIAALMAERQQLLG
jgi:hypothetical protein